MFYQYILSYNPRNNMKRESSVDSLFMFYTIYNFIDLIRSVQQVSEPAYNPIIFSLIMERGPDMWQAIHDLVSWYVADDPETVRKHLSAFRSEDNLQRR